MDEQREWIKLRRKKRLRLLAVVMCASLLVTSYPNILETWSVSAAAEKQGIRENLYIYGFEELSEEIKEQYVPVGTELEELTLPAVLEVSVGEIGSNTPENTDNGADDEKTENDGMESEETSGGEDTSEDGDGNEEDSEGQSDTETDSGEENTDIENGEGQDGQSGESVEEETDTAEMDTEEDADNDTDLSEESMDSNEPEGAAITQETYTVTLPEYQAENVITVETLENTQDTEPENAADATVTISDVTWQSEPEYDENTEGTYIFTAVLPDGYTLAEGVSMPKITVTVQEIDIDIVVQTLLDRIAALPDAVEYLSNEPEAGDEEAYAEWEEKLYEYAEEALAIWEEYEALTEKQQAQVPEKVISKLTAWVELAEQLAETDRVMLADDSEHHADWTALTTDKTQLDGGNYYLADDVTMDTIVIEGTVTLCLNGHTLTHSDTDGSVILVAENATFTLCDCQDHWDYTSSFDEDTKTYTCEVTGNGGCITGGTGKVDGSKVYGGGVYVSSGATFNMTSGRITRCDVGTGSNHNGGGVYVTGGEFNMSGGVIDTNNANGGGGIYIEDDGTFEMSSDRAVIMLNTATQSAGVICSTGKFDMKDGKIIGNSANMISGGVNVGTNASLSMTGGLIEGNTINSNVAFPAGMYIYGNVEISGGVIRYNVSNSTNALSCGGVKVQSSSGNSGSLRLSGEIQIFDNYCNNNQSNLFITTGKPITIADALSNPIGITSQTKPSKDVSVEVANNGGGSYTITNDDWQCFTSDSDSYEILKKETDTGNELWLVEKGSCDLGDLDLSAEGATLSPAFAADITEYTSTVANSVEKVGIMATLADSASDASITMKINGGTETSMISGVKQEAALAEGENTIEITVTSGEMSKTYTLVITREEAKRNRVTITAYKDGNVWSDDPPLDFKLKPDDGTSSVEDLTAVPDGEYKIYVGDTDTKVTVTVAGAEVDVRIDYYTVTFYDKDTALTAPEQQTVLKDTVVSAPTDKPTKTGYTFDKWVTAHGGSTEYDFTAAVTGKTSVYASWTLDTYTITYELNGGTATGNPASYTIESSDISLKEPTKAGYTFTGWSGTGLTGEDNMTVTIPAGSTGNRTYEAHWANADYTVTLHTNGGSGGTELTSYAYGTGAVLPTNWTKTGYTFAGWYDNEGCTGTAVTSISNTDTGNKEFWAKWTDNIAPVIGTLQYSYQPKNFWHWLIGKDSLMITVPITEEGSGADEITYIVTPEGGTASTKTSTIVNGEAKITVSADFKGTIVISCTDKAGNTSASVTVGKDLDGSVNGIIIEDNPPQIAFEVNGSVMPETDEYETAPAVTVTITDNKDNAVSAGIASVSYSVGNGSTKTVDHDYITGMVVNDSFVIPASEIPVGETVITVTATDNAGNTITETKTVKVHSHSGRFVAAVAPTCTLEGSREHYICTCGKYFEDSGCTREIADITENALGHDFDSSPYQFDGTQHWRKCSRCAVQEQKEDHDFDDTTNKCKVCGYSRVVDPGHTHSGTLIAATAPTCTLPGNKAYYLCSCAKLFSDSACTIETTEADIVLAALGHAPGSFAHDQNEHWNKCTRCGEEQERGNHVYDNDSDLDCNVCGYVRTIAGHTHSAVQTVNEKPATCTENGNKAYYICSCGKWFSDNACTNEITDHASVVLGKLGHDFSGKYQFDENGHWKVCSRCNISQTKENHVYDDNNDTTCNKCDYKRKIDNPGTDNKDDSDDEPPVPQPTPEPTPNPSEPSQPPSPTNPPGTQPPIEQPDSRPGTTPSTPENGQPEDDGEPESTETPEMTEQPVETEKEPEGEPEQTVPASIDNDRITVSGEPIRTGNVNDMKDTSTTLSLGNGAIIVTVVCKDQTYTAGVADTVAVANAVLTQEQLELVNNGETIEIRIEVTDISDSVPKQDKEVIESGIEEYSREVPGLTLGMYVDLSMYIKIGTGDWNAITATKEPIEVIIGVPDNLQEKSRTYYIIRAHEGEYTFMSDMDSEPDTITISTDMFSSYAIAYVQAEGKGAKCGLCHICPTFLGICYFIWLAIIIAVILIIYIIIRRKKRQEKEKEK